MINSIIDNVRYNHEIYNAVSQELHEGIRDACIRELVLKSSNDNGLIMSIRDSSEDPDEYT